MSILECIKNDEYGVYDGDLDENISDCKADNENDMPMIKNSERRQQRW